LRDQSILAQRKDPTLYPELTLVGQEFLRMRFYRDWDVSRGSVLRRPQPADLPNDFLAENGENLALVVNALQNRPEVKKALLDNLKLLWDAVEDVITTTQGGTVQIFFHERGFKTPVPMARLSDGTLRLLCLLAILCHPEPPPLVCIEEPELGLHPDAVATVAKLLVDAASRTQLVVTTHSDVLVSALSEVPEAVVVCERTEAGTSLRRLEPARLEGWLESYRLGELWRMGEIGGTRW
jgi:predicted ATPase